MSGQGLKMLLPHHYHFQQSMPCARLNYILKRFFSENAKTSGVTKIQSKSRMKAWRMYQYGGPEELVLSDKAKIPTIENPNELLVEVHAASVNPIDVLMRGGYGRRMLDYIRKRVSGSLVLGRDFSGVVVKTGAMVTNFRPGDEVWGTLAAHRQGSHAEFVVTSTNEISFKPLSLSHVEAASIPYVAATTWEALYSVGRMRPENTIGKRVLIHAGAGGIGTFAIQLMSAWGGHVTTVCSTDAIELVTSLGADAVVDYKTQNAEQELANMEKFDIILDPLGIKKTGYSMKTLKKSKGSSFITLSTPLLSYTDSYGVPTGLTLWGGEIASVYFTSSNYKLAFFTPSKKAMTTVANMVDNGQIRPVVEKVFPFSELPEAYKKVGELHGRGKTVISMK